MFICDLMSIRTILRLRNVIKDIEKRYSLNVIAYHCVTLLFSRHGEKWPRLDSSTAVSQIQPASRRAAVLNAAREMVAASREDQKEENKEPTRKSSEIPTRRGDTSTGARHVGIYKTSSFVPSDFLCLSFVSSLLHSAELDRKSVV